MRFSTPLLCGATLAAFGSASRRNGSDPRIPAVPEMLSDEFNGLDWVGSDSFAPQQSAEVIILTDAATTNHILSYTVVPIRRSMDKFFNAYHKAGLTVKVAVHQAGAQDGLCWKARLEMTDDVGLIKQNFTRGFMDGNDQGKPANFWNVALHVAESGRFTRDDEVRRVVVILSENTPAWGSEITQPDLSSIECGHPSPPAEQFKKVVEKNRFAVVYSAQNIYISATVEAAAKVTELLTATGLSDWKVVSKKSAAAGIAEHGRSVMPALAEVLSPEWIATTTTTLSPTDKLEQCLKQSFSC